MKHFPDRGPDAGEAASYVPRINKRSHTYDGKNYIHHDLSIDVTPPPPTDFSSELIPVLWHSQPRKPGDFRTSPGPFFGNGVGYPLEASGISIAAKVWPQLLEAFAANGAERLAANIDWSGAIWENKRFLEPLLDGDVPLTHMAGLLLVIGLACKEPGEHGLATDVAIRAITDGRLDSQLLGDQLGDLLSSGLIKLGRWAKRFAVIARVSEWHAFVIRRALAHALRQIDPAQPPNDLQSLLELLHEESINAGDELADTECRERIAQFTGSSKAAKAAKALLSLKRNDARWKESWQAASIAGIEGRLQRLETWQRRR